MLKTGYRKTGMMKTGTMRSPSGGLVYIFGDVEKDKIEKR